ncbi:hypothetical protein [Cronobacter phage JC01]|uniref:Uncharacterized protein n=1 Tax=Cronobacter phage JC01 TaxID=2729575 RepID=A0A6M3YKF9_9CAUD|nr:hypothetical protein JT331_gp46 [Cronobacter phage JC01]QJI52273.1 hypothetical protein [Cronobacter phage JC01]
MVINHTKGVGAAVTIVLAVLFVFYLWSAVSSSICTTTGINQQTRTSWAPFTGCVVDSDISQPWNSRESR